jgi:hypothetical protein
MSALDAPLRPGSLRATVPSEGERRSTSVREAPAATARSESFRLWPYSRRSTCFRGELVVPGLTCCATCRAEADRSMGG